MSNYRLLFESGKASFIPKVCQLAARLEQVEADTLRSDPGVLVRAVRNAWHLFGYSGVLVDDLELCERALNINSCHRVLSMENIDELYDFDINHSQETAVIVEAINRLRTEIKQAVPIVLRLPSPNTLLETIFGPIDPRAGGELITEALGGIAQLISRLIRGAAEAGATGILMQEQRTQNLIKVTNAAFEQTSGAIWNIASYYQVPLIFQFSGSPDIREIESICKLAVTAVAVAAKAFQDQPAICQAIDNAGKQLVPTLPNDVLRGEMTWEQWITIWGKERLTKGLIVSEDEIPADLEPEILHEVTKRF